MEPAQPKTPPSSYGRAIGLALAAVALVSIVLLAFSWPSLTAEPHDIPIGAVGQEAQIDHLEQALDQQSEGVFLIEHYHSREDAVTAIEHREIYGSIVLSESGPEMLVATAANATVAQMLQAIASGLQAQMGAPVQVTDIVPFAEHDPRGAGLASATLPLVMGGMLGAVLISSAIHGSRRRLLALGVYGVVGGLVLAAILQGWLGALQGSFILNASAIGLSVIAISAVLVGLRSLIGMPGLGIGAAIMFLLANPLSSAQAPVEFMLKPWGEIGQWFPPGAGAALLRKLSYFPEADASFQWWVLGGWAILGVLLLGLAALRKPVPAADQGSRTVPSSSTTSPSAMSES